MIRKILKLRRTICIIVALFALCAMLTFSVIPISADSGAVTDSTGPPLWLLLVAVLVPLTVIADIAMLRQIKNVIQNHAGTDGFGTWTWACQSRKRFYVAVAITMTFILVALPLFVVRQLLLLLSNAIKDNGGTSLSRVVRWTMRICQTQIIVPIFSLKRVAAFSIRTVRGASILLASIVCICAVIATWIIFGPISALMLMLAVAVLVSIEISRTMKRNGFNFSTMFDGLIMTLGLEGPATGFGATTNANNTGKMKVSGFHLQLRRGQRQVPVSGGHTERRMSGFLPFSQVFGHKTQHTGPPTELSSRTDITVDITSSSSSDANSLTGAVVGSFAQKGR